MKKRDLDKFFKAVAEKIQISVKVYLTGGVAAWFYGGTRPTLDVDFALKVGQDWDEVATIFREISRQQGIAVEFSEDISRWGMIGYPQFEKGAQFYQRWGNLQVYFLDPVIWSVGKIARYTNDDISDVEAVFKKQKVDPGLAMKIWAEAHRKSPRSTEQGLFAKKVEDFLRNSGPRVWGRGFEVSKYRDRFSRSIRRN